MKKIVDIQRDIKRGKKERRREAAPKQKKKKISHLGLGASWSKYYLIAA